MTANELADELDESRKESYTSEHLISKAANMLRQQQDEINDLKQQVAFLEDWRDTWSPFLKAITGKVNEE